MTSEHPLVLVFYMNRETRDNQELMHYFVQSVNQTIKMKEANAMAFFVPTKDDDDPERVECINPVQVEKTEMDRIMKMVDDIGEAYDMGGNKKDDE